MAIKLTAGLLRKIIREEVEAVKAKEETVEEMDQAVGDKGFDDILVSEGRRRLKEELTLATVALGTILGILGLEAIGIAGKAAARVIGNMAADAREKLQRKAAEARASGQAAAVAAMANDKKLAEMLFQLESMRGNATAKEVTAFSKAITTYVANNMPEGDYDLDAIGLRNRVRSRIGIR
jgi:Mn-containing catalase